MLSMCLAVDQGFYCLRHFAWVLRDASSIPFHTVAACGSTIPFGPVSRQAREAVYWRARTGTLGLLPPMASRVTLATARRVKV